MNTCERCDRLGVSDVSEEGAEVGRPIEPVGAIMALEGTLTLHADHRYVVVPDGDLAASPAEAECAAVGFLDLGHRVHRHDVTVTGVGDGAGGRGLRIVSDTFPRYDVVLRLEEGRQGSADDGSMGGAAAATWTGEATSGWQRYAFRLEWAPGAASVPERLDDGDAPNTAFARRVSAVEQRVATTVDRHFAQQSAEQRAALRLELPWALRRRLPMHYTAMLWSRAFQQPTRTTALGRLNPDAMSCIFDFLNDAPFLAFLDNRNGWGSGGGGPAAPLLFVEHTGRFTMGVHVRLMCGGVYVRRPTFDTKHLHMRWEAEDNADSLRETKPLRADLAFDYVMGFFQGRVAFPGEGEISYGGAATWLVPGISAELFRQRL